jgi:hypothetical protein
MKKYKPEFLGKCLAVDDPSKMTNFLSNQYDSFSKIYDLCKNESDKIKDVKVVTDNNEKLSLKVSTSLDTLNDIKQKVTDESISIDNDIITAKK